MTPDKFAEAGQNWLASRVADGTLTKEEAERRARAAARIRAQAALLRMKLQSKETKA